MNFLAPALIIWRIATLFSSFIAQKIVPYLGFFPYKEMLDNYHLPRWVSAFANFDGLHYLRIAEQGYSQYEQAFFPFYPLLIRFLSPVFMGNMMVSAFVISTVCFFGGIILFLKFLSKIETGESAVWALIFLLLFPTSFYFGAVYTEGLFLLLVAASLYFLKDNKYILAGLFAALSSATRLIGIFLIIPFLFSLIDVKKYHIKTNKRFVFFLLAPCLGLVFYMIYLWASTGDPFIFFNAQPKFGANRSTNLVFLPQVYYRYLKIIFTASHNFQWVMSIVEMVFFTLISSILLLDLFSIIKKVKNHLFLLGLNFFSFANIVLPTLTGTFSSIPRYSLFSLSFFLYLGRIKSRRVKVAIAVLFLTGQIILLSLFVQGYFVG